MKWLTLPNPVVIRLHATLFFNLLQNKKFIKCFTRSQLRFFITQYLENMILELSQSPDIGIGEDGLIEFIKSVLTDNGDETFNGVETCLDGMHECLVSSGLHKAIVDYVNLYPWSKWTFEFSGQSLMLINQGDWRIHAWVAQTVAASGQDDDLGSLNYEDVLK